MDGDNFLSRWSRRKAQANGGPAEVPVAAVPEVRVEPVASTALASSQLPDTGAKPAPPDAAPVGEPPPTMAEVALLRHDSDFSRFVAPGTSEGVKHAAMKKLFSDPHFNVMDGLDTYIDDYGKPDPIPIAMLRRMTQSATLRLFEHEEEQSKEALESLPTASLEAATPDPDLTPHNDDADLQLQPDDAAGRPRIDQGAGP
jgi:hypothetical protein